MYSLLPFMSFQTCLYKEDI